MWYFNTPLTSTDRSNKQKISKEIQALNDTMDQVNLIDIYRTFLWLWFSVIVIFILSALWWRRIRGSWKLLTGETEWGGKLGFVLMGRAMFSKPLIQFLLMGGAVFPPCCFDLKPNYHGDNEDNGNLLQKVPPLTAALNVPDPVEGHCWPTPLLEIPGY